MIYHAGMTKREITSQTPAGSLDLPIKCPAAPESEVFSNAQEAVDRLIELYELGTDFLREQFTNAASNRTINTRFRAFYPELRLKTVSHTRVDSRLAFGYVGGPGEYSTTITRPKLFAFYLRSQIELLMSNHGVPVTVGLSDTPIPLHFSFLEGTHLSGSMEDHLDRPLRDVFDVPDLSSTDDSIVNAKLDMDELEVKPLAPFTAQRIDYSLHRLSHYTATAPEHFQNFVLFTNYQFYVDEFASFAEKALGNPNSGYTSFVQPGNHVTLKDGTVKGAPVDRLPQMPTYHLTRDNGAGITMVNIGVGPSNAKTATDHIAVLRPHAWLMLGHCAGLRNSQSLGDYVLAHAYVREDHVLDDDLPPSRSLWHSILAP